MAAPSFLTLQVSPRLTVRPKKKLGPTMKRGRSRNDYQTPEDFLRAVEARWGRLGFDIAARAGESVLGLPHFGPGSKLGEDALVRDWPRKKLGWLNPPFDPMLPWVARAARAAAGGWRGIVLAPAEVSTDWFADWVWPYARVVPIRPRLTFVGEIDPFMKGLMLLLYGFNQLGVELWKWK